MLVKMMPRTIFFLIVQRNGCPSVSGLCTTSSRLLAGAKIVHHAKRSLRGDFGNALKRARTSLGVLKSAFEVLEQPVPISPSNGGDTSSQRER